MHQELCKNCNHVYQGNFCSNCGQKTNTVRLDWHFVKDELEYTFLHVNKGLLYTAKQLLTRPGDMTREFIEGKRVKHYKPILLVFVLAGINGLLLHYIPYEEILKNNGFASVGNIEQEKAIQFMTEIYDFMAKKYAFFELGSIPIFSLCTWLAYKKWGYNYVENVVINCFGSAQRLLIGILAFPIQLLFIHSKHFLSITSLLSIPLVGATIWLYIQLYKDKNTVSFLMRSLLFVLYASITIFMIFMIFATIIGILLAKGHIDKSYFGL